MTIETAGETREKRWYVIHTYSGYENKVKANLEHRIESMGMEDKIFRVMVPVEEAMEIKDGKKKRFRWFWHKFSEYTLPSVKGNMPWEIRWVRAAVPAKPCFGGWLAAAHAQRVVIRKRIELLYGKTQMFEPVSRFAGTVHVGFGRSHRPIHARVPIDAKGETGGVQQGLHFFERLVPQLSSSARPPSEDEPAALVATGRGVRPHAARLPDGSRVNAIVAPLAIGGALAAAVFAGAIILFV